MTSRRIARLCLVYLGLFLLGLAISQLASGASWKAFGLGLMVPGGGFLAHADVETWHGAVHIALAAMAMMLFLAALLLWFATGNVFAPPLVWLLSAIAAAAMNHGDVQLGVARGVPLAVVAAIVATVMLALVRRRRAAARRQLANGYLKAARAQALASLPDARDPPGREELTPHDLRRMRFLLDRALQPVASYDGFEWLDQFQTAAVRYQLNFIGYALAMVQATRLPALGGYLNTAQRRLIDKQTDHRIWRYWAIENLWGNLATDPDPVARENIMFTGFCAAQIAMYHAASGRRDYDRPGSFALKHPSGRSYDHDFSTLIAALDRERQRSAFHLIACEPNWIYPICNTIGAIAMKAHDRMTGSQVWSSNAPGFRHHLESEFIDLSGRFVPCRSAYGGFALPMIGGAQPQAMPCFFLNATLPDIAARHWLLLRRNLLKRDQGLDRRRFWRIDTGNYGFSRGAAFAGTALAAIEMGDQEVARSCLAALDEECPAIVETGVCYRPKASIWAHGVEFLARSGEENGLRNLIERPRARPGDLAPQPLISEVPYPDVLVARAVHGPDSLAAVLYPGERAGRYRLGLSGLVPEGSYACEGAEESRVVADSRGTATITVGLAGRTETRIHAAT